jgi:hypothetical protein
MRFVALREIIRESDALTASVTRGVVPGEREAERACANGGMCYPVTQRSVARHLEISI